MVGDTAAGRAIRWALCCSLAVHSAAVEARSLQAGLADGIAQAAPERLAMHFDFISALGRYWGEPEVRDLLASLQIPDKLLPLNDYAMYLHNHRIGIELTFQEASWLKVRLRDYPPGALILRNIRMYGEKFRSFAPYPGELPFGLRFGESRQSVIEKLGPPDSEIEHLGLMRWDRDRYSLFAMLSPTQTLITVSVQTPVVRTSRPGFAR
jgi:hypothetical protein